MLHQRNRGIFALSGFLGSLVRKGVIILYQKHLKKPHSIPSARVLATSPSPFCGLDRAVTLHSFSVLSCPFFQLVCSLLLLPQFKTHISHYYPLLCNMLLVDCKLELRSVLRRVFQRVGTTFLICDDPESS